MTNLEQLNNINTKCFNKQLYAWIMNLLEYQTFDETSIVNEIDVYRFLEDEYTGQLYEEGFCVPADLLVKIMEQFVTEASHGSESYYKGAGDLRKVIMRYING